MTTAKEICEGVPKSCLDRAVSDIHIAQLAQVMTEWQEFAPFFDLSPADEEDIVDRYRGRLPLQKREALRKWKEINGSRATYRKLIVIFCSQGRADLAEEVKSLLLMSKDQSAGSVMPNTSDVIEVFHDYLHDCYSGLPHPSSLQWPGSSSSNECYVELALFDVPMKGDDKPINLEPIALKSLFAAGSSKAAKRKVVLIEGIAGVGKTTLSWHACKEWAAGRLFGDIKLLIHVSLSDCTFHSASKLADLIPHPSEEMRISITKAISDKRGKGICFLLEGCDEAPRSLWETFLFRFVTGTGGRSMLPDAHIVLVSRPAGIPAQAAKCLTGKVLVRGFDLLDYVNALQLENKDQLLQALEMRPELYSLCHLPLNAMILAYLYDNFSDTLPSTRTGLFNLFVQHFLLRHIQTRTTYCEFTTIDNFPADLPSDILLSLTKVSKLAYQSVLERGRMIDQKVLSEYGLGDIDNAFGFLQVHQRLTMHGLRKQFTFIHLSLQEFLAAFYISQMDKHQQVAAFKSVFDQNPLSPVLTFYAGLTCLNIGEVRDMLLKVLDKSISIDDIVKGLGLDDPNTIHDVNPAHDLRRHMLALMNCMYETQDLNLFAHMKLPTCKLWRDHSESDVHIQSVQIRLLGMLLYPTDCLAIGYFIRHAGSQTNEKVLQYAIDCSCCLLGEVEIKTLAMELQKPPHKSNISVILFFFGVYISTKAVDCLAALISTDSCVTGLNVDGYLIEDIALFLKCCIEGFINKHTSQPKLLVLQSLCSSPNVIYYLILLLRCPCLNSLDLSSGNHFLFANPSAILLFCEALRYSHLMCLNLSDCGIDDDSLISLMATVCHEGCTVGTLDLHHNPYSEDGLTCSLKLLLKSSPFV